MTAIDVQQIRSFSEIKQEVIKMMQTFKTSLEKCMNNKYKSARNITHAIKFKHMMPLFQNIKYNAKYQVIKRACSCALYHYME
jgi:hypothetical protein